MMKNFKKREYNSLDGSFLKNHNVQKKHKANVLAYENRIPIDWHQVKIILDATVVEKYLNNRKSGSTISPFHREKIFVQKIPRLNQNVFSERNNVMVKLEIPDDIKVDDNLSPTGSLVFPDVPVKQENCTSVQDSLDNDTFHDREFVESSNEDFQCKDKNNFTAEAVLKNEVVESESCYGEVTISREFQDALKNEELFVGEEFKHEESVPSYENVESIHQENHEEIMKKKTRSTRKRKRCLECDDCNHGLEKKSRVPSHSQVVTSKLSVQDAKKCKSQAPSKPSQPKSSLRAKEQRTNQESSTKPSAKKKLELTPVGRSYREFRKYFLEMESEHIKLYCLKCEVTRDKTISNTAPRCDICKSQLLYQCQRCKRTRTYYSDIWEHLMNQNSGCSITDSLIGDDEPANTANLVPTDSANESSNSTNQAKSHDCEICGFRGTKTTQLVEHVENVHLDDGIIKSGFGTAFHFGEVRFMKHEGLCGVTARFPCRFCPLTCYDTYILFDHIAIMHLDEVDANDIGEFVKEARNFKRMVKAVNYQRFIDKLRNGTAKTGRNDYHNGIESMLKPICIECKADGPHNREYCEKCHVNLNFVCLMCDELFSKYSVAWDHATRTCENRSFTLTIGETCRAKLDASMSDEKLFYCNHCGFKNASKSILYDHIESAHQELSDNQSLLSCSKNLTYVFTCLFCDKSSSEFSAIEKHITKIHAKHFRCKDTLEDILNRVIENKRPRTKKPIYRYDGFGRRIRRTFSENLKLATLFCFECDEIVHKNFRRVADTSKCPKCNFKLRVYCKICNKDYSCWPQIAAHFQNAKCGAAIIGKHNTDDLDHSYCLRLQPLPEFIVC